MPAIRLMAYRRTDNRAARRLRREGKLPALLFGCSTEEPIFVDPQALMMIVEAEVGADAVIDLFINGDPPERCQVTLRAMQTNAVTLAPVYADFYRVS